MKTSVLVLALFTAHAHAGPTCNPVRIEVVSEGSKSFGSGILWKRVNDWYVVTADHIIPSEHKQIDSSLGALTLQARSWTRDTALLKLKTAPNNKGVCQLGLPTAEVETEFTVLGYPASSTVLQKSTGTGLPSLANSLELVGSVKGLAVSATTVTGMSGGPVLDRLGNVRGMLIQKKIAKNSKTGEYGDEHIALAISLDHLLTIADSLASGTQLDSPFERNMKEGWIRAGGLKMEIPKSKQIISIGAAKPTKGDGDPHDQGGEALIWLKLMDIDSAQIPTQWKDVLTLWKNLPSEYDLYISGVGEQHNISNSTELLRLMQQSWSDPTVKLTYELRLKNEKDEKQAESVFKKEVSDWVAAEIIALSTLKKMDASFGTLADKAKAVLNKIETTKSIPVSDLKALHQSIRAQWKTVESALTSFDYYDAATDLITAMSAIEAKFPRGSK